MEKRNESSDTNDRKSVRSFCPSVTIIVLNWESYEDTSECLRSLRELEYKNLETIIVDNGSTDGSGQRLANEFPGTDVLFNEGNLGFAEGMNEGIEQAMSQNSDYVLVLNNDTYISQRDLIDRMLIKMESEKDIVGVSPKIFYYDDPEEVWFESSFIDWKRGDAGHRSTSEQFNSTSNDYLPLCCAMFDAEALKEVGRIPNQFFLYYEDVALGVALKENGYKLATVQDAVIYHKESSSTGHGLGVIRSYYSTRNRWLFMHIFDSNLSPRFYMTFFFWSTIRLMYRIYKREFKGSKALVEGVIDGIRMRTGKGPYP